MNEHFQKHQYYKNHILHRYKHLKKPKTPPRSESEYSDSYDSDTVVDVSDSTPPTSPSPTPSPTPSPVNNLREPTPLFLDEVSSDPNFSTKKLPNNTDHSGKKHSLSTSPMASPQEVPLSPQVSPQASPRTVPQMSSPQSSPKPRSLHTPPYKLRKIQTTLPSLENYIPPSHILKIVKDAENLSDSSVDTDEEGNVNGGGPSYIVRDGKPGRYIRNKDNKYVKVDTLKRCKEKRKLIKCDNNNNNTIQREVQYIKYLDDESPNDNIDNNLQNENNIKDNDTVDNDALFVPEKRNDSDGELDGEMDSKVDSDEESDKRIESKIEGENEENIDKENDENKEEGNEEGRNEEEEEEEKKDSEEEEKKEETKEKILVEKYSNLRQDTPEDFDAKKVYDEDSDLDEFGRRKDRQRPSSSIYDYLPSLRPDPVLDEGDVNKCKERLMKNTVVIREALARNERHDLETVVDLIVSNNNDNRRWLRKMYRDEYLQSLLLDLRKTLPADVASVISTMMIPICEFDAMCLWDALKGLHKDPEVLCEILCTRSNKELAAIRDAYYMRYDDELVDHIEDETIDIFQKMLMRLALGKRERDGRWSKAEAATEARALSALLDVKGEYLEKKLIDVFCKHPIEMLRVILIEYRKFKGRDMDADIVNIIKGDFCRCILTIMHYIQNPPNYFVEKLHNTHFKGVDDDKTLCRIIISRSERDVVMIKELFLLRYDMELFDYVNQVCHGPLKGLVLRIVAGYKADDYRNRMFPPLWPGDENLDLLQRLTLPMAVQIMLRKSKVVSKCVKVLYAARKEREQSDTESSESDLELEVDPDPDEEEDEKQIEALDSEEEEERAATEAQRELRNGLKNISFADNVDVADPDPSFKSVFAEVSFAAASRGILKNTENQEEEVSEIEETQEVGLDDELGQQILLGPKMTQLNGPVLDPTFIGRGEASFRTKFKKGKKKVFRGTVKGMSMDQFNALKDAQAIGKAMLQKNRNTEGILQFLTTRNNAQRQLIIREFFRRYRRDLVDDLRTLAPQHEEITLSMLLSGEIYDSASLYAAINDGDNDTTVDVFIEILCSRQNDEIAIIKRAFQGIFGMDLNGEISKITRGPFQTLLCNIADCQRDEGDIVDECLARKDAQALYEALIKTPTNFKVLTEIFGTRSFPHIESVCDNYSKIAHTDVLEVLDEALHGDFLEGVTAIICNIRDAPMHFCERIYRSVSYEKMNYSMLIRCIVSRAEVDLAVIKATFRRTYGRTIYAMIEKDCNFKSKKILLDVVKK